MSGRSKHQKVHDLWEDQTGRCADCGNPIRVMPPEPKRRAYPPGMALLAKRPIGDRPAGVLVCTRCERERNRALTLARTMHDRREASGRPGLNATTP